MPILRVIAYSPIAHCSVRRQCIEARNWSNSIEETWLGYLVLVISSLPGHNTTIMSGCMFSRVLVHSIYQELSIVLKHIETRPSKTCPGSGYDVFVECRCSSDMLSILEERLKDVVGTVSTHEWKPEDSGVRTDCKVR